jgi:hypothetical protein
MCNKDKKNSHLEKQMLHGLLNNLKQQCIWLGHMFKLVHLDMKTFWCYCNPIYSSSATRHLQSISLRLASYFPPNDMKVMCLRNTGLCSTHPVSEYLPLWGKWNVSTKPHFIHL